MCQSDEDEDEPAEDYSCPPPTCLECFDLWAVFIGFMGAVFAITNHYGKFIGFETFSMWFQVIAGILFMISPLKKVFFKCDKSDSAVIFMRTEEGGV